MTKLNCCRCSKLDPKMTDMGRVDEFELMLGRCSKCGVYWMDAFCVAANTTGYARISEDDARKMLSLPPGPELKAFLKAWDREHI
jgi:hypothetical protein